MAKVIERTVDNRTFLLGLDELYRDAMKCHEQGELLTCARHVAERLGSKAADVPIEGYYTETEELTEYFRLMRGLQAVQTDNARTVLDLPQCKRLKQVTSSRIFGLPCESTELIPQPMDALSMALHQSPMEQWNVDCLMPLASDIARESDDFSLVGLAARVQDAVALTAVRESVVLYAHVEIGAALFSRAPRYVYAWEVDDELSKWAGVFVTTFNDLFNEKLPAVEASNAEVYWHAGDKSDIQGRCVQIGIDDRVRPNHHYHWAIRWTPSNLLVEEFWSPELWTTKRFRSEYMIGMKTDQR